MTLKEFLESFDQGYFLSHSVLDLIREHGDKELTALDETDITLYFNKVEISEDEISLQKEIK